MSFSFPCNYRQIDLLETAAAKRLGLTGASAFDSTHQHLRSFLIVALAATLPINIVFGDDKSATNMAASDVLMPLGILFLGWLLMKGRLVAPMMTLCLFSSSILLASVFYNLDIYFRNEQTLKIAVEVGKLTCLWFLFYLFVNLIHNRSDLRLLLKVWVLASVVEALCGIGGSLLYQLAGIETLFSEQFRAQGTLGDSNLFATHLAAGVFLTLLYRRLFSPAPYCIVFAIFVQAAGIYFSASRGVLLSFAIVLLLWWLFAASRWQKVIGVVGLGALILALWMTNWSGLVASNPITERLRTSTLSLNDPEAQQRVALWRVALQGFSSSPVLGVGSGNFAYLSNTGSWHGAKAHNTYLEILCEKGLAGFIAYMAFVLAVLSRLYPTRVPLHDSHRRAASALLFAAVVLLGLSGVTISIENYRGLWVLLALVVAYHRLYIVRTPLELGKAPAVAGA